MNVKEIFKQIPDIDFSKYNYKITYGKSGRTDRIEIRPNNKINPNIDICYKPALHNEKENILIEIMHRTNTWCPILRLKIFIGGLAETAEDDFYSNIKELLEKELSLYMIADSNDIFRFIKNPVAVSVAREKATLVHYPAEQIIYIS